MRATTRLDSFDSFSGKGAILDKEFLIFAREDVVRCDGFREKWSDRRSRGRWSPRLTHQCCIYPLNDDKAQVSVQSSPIQQAYII